MGNNGKVRGEGVTDMTLEESKQESIEAVTEIRDHWDKVICLMRDMPVDVNPNESEQFVEMIGHIADGAKKGEQLRLQLLTHVLKDRIARRAGASLR